jgi:hypothetical protein
MSIIGDKAVENTSSISSSVVNDAAVLFTGAVLPGKHSNF